MPIELNVNCQLVWQAPVDGSGVAIRRLGEASNVRLRVTWSPAIEIQIRFINARVDNPGERIDSDFIRVSGGLFDLSDVTPIDPRFYRLGVYTVQVEVSSPGAVIGTLVSVLPTEKAFSCEAGRFEIVGETQTVAPPAPGPVTGAECPPGQMQEVNFQGIPTGRCIPRDGMDGGFEPGGPIGPIPPEFGGPVPQPIPPPQIPVAEPGAVPVAPVGGGGGVGRVTPTLTPGAPTTNGRTIPREGAEPIPVIVWIVGIGAGAIVLASLARR